MQIRYMIDRYCTTEVVVTVAEAVTSIIRGLIVIVSVIVIKRRCMQDAQLMCALQSDWKVYVR